MFINSPNITSVISEKVPCVQSETGYHTVTIMVGRDERAFADKRFARQGDIESHEYIVFMTCECEQYQGMDLVEGFRKLNQQRSDDWHTCYDPIAAVREFLQSCDNKDFDTYTISNRVARFKNELPAFLGTAVQRLGRAATNLRDLRKIVDYPVSTRTIEERMGFFLSNKFNYAVGSNNGFFIRWAERHTYYLLDTVQQRTLAKRYKGEWYIPTDFDRALRSAARNFRMNTHEYCGVCDEQFVRYVNHTRSDKHAKTYLRKAMIGLRATTSQGLKLLKTEGPGAFKPRRGRQPAPRWIHTVSDWRATQ